MTADSTNTPAVSSAILSADAGLTMSSREIAELTGKEHKHVRRDIKKLFAENGLPESGCVQIWTDPQNGQEYEEYRLPQNLTYTLVAGYRSDLRLKIVNRWMELERGAAPTTKPKRVRRPSVLSVFRSGKEIARLAGFDETQASLRAARYCEKKCGENPLELMGITYQPAVAQVTYLLATEIGERLGLGTGRIAAIAANKAMQRHGYQTKDDRDRWQPTAKGCALAKLDETNRKHSSGTAQAWHWHPDLVAALRADLDAEKATAPFARTPEAVS
jgi:hypothetical protein